VVRQNFSRDQNGAVLAGVSLNTIIASIQYEDFGGRNPSARGADICIRMGGKSVRTRPLAS